MTPRVTLAPSVTRVDFERVAFARAWRLHDVVEPGEDRPYEEIWVTDAGTTAAHYIEDDLIGVAYVDVMGDDDERFAAELGEDLTSVDARTAAREARFGRSLQDRLDGLSRLAAAAPPVADAELVSAWAELLADPDPDVRQGALFAAAYPSWPELDPLIERVRATDQEPRIREAADKALAAIRRHRSGGTR